MDTVSPGTGVVPIDDDDRFRTAGETILGADDKVGVAAILATLEHVTRSGEEHRGIDAVITVQEEPGLLGAKNLDFSLLEGDWGVVLDGSGPVGGIIMEAPGQYRLKFEVRGRSAHAGVEPEKGINAISCAAEAISGLDLGRLDPQTTANIGLIEGGRAVNIVPDLVVVEGEIRSLSEGRLEEERERMVEQFKQVAGSRGCGLDLEVERSFPGFKLDPDAKPVQHLLKAMRMCGVEPDLITSGGGSDANVFNVRGITAATMNIGLVNAHSQQEYVLKEDLVTVTRIVSSLVSMTHDEQGVVQP
jgi:tripeptide aminopeptidase